MKKTLLVLFSPLLCLLLAGCGGGFFYPDFLEGTPSPPPSPSPPAIVMPNPRPEVYTFGIPYVPAESFQPLRDSSRHNGEAARLCYEGLIELNAAFVPEYVLASNIQTEDNVTYTVALNPSACFSNGDSVRPEDVKASYDLARAQGGPYTERLSCVGSVSAGEDQVIITMTGPVFNAAALMDIPIVKDAEEGAAPLGTGPYTFKQGEEGAYLLQNEAWWRGTGPLPVSRIELVEAKGPGDLVIGFGQTYISLMPMDVHDTLAPGIKGNCDKTPYPTPLMQYIGFNMENRFLSRPGTRRALSMAFDREGITQKLYGDLADASGLPVPPGSPLFDPAAAGQFAYDPEGAKALLEGQNIPGLRFIVDAGSACRVQAAEIYAEALRSLGIDVDFKILGWKAFTDAVREGDYDLYYAEVLPAPNFPPRALALREGALNPGGVSSPELDSAIAELEAASGTEQEAALKEVWRLFYEEAPVITVCFRKMQVYSQFGLIGGLAPTYYNPYHGWKDISIYK